MIRCQKCGKLSKRGERTFLLVTETRPMTYQPAGIGFETVREIRICVDCQKREEAARNSQ